MAFKMKGPTFFNVGKEYNIDSATFQQKGKLKKGQGELKKQTSSWKGTEGQDQDKIFDKDGNHIGNWVDGKKVLFDKGDDRSYYNSLVKKEKDGSITKSEQNALDRLRAEEG